MMPLRERTKVRNVRHLLYRIESKITDAFPVIEQVIRLLASGQISTLSRSLSIVTVAKDGAAELRRSSARAPPEIGVLPCFQWRSAKRRKNEAKPARASMYVDTYRRSPFQTRPSKCQPNVRLARTRHLTANPMLESRNTTHRRKTKASSFGVRFYTGKSETSFKGA